MDAQRYLRIGIIGIICLVVIMTGYAVFLNEVSRRHIDKMEAAQYTVLAATRAGYRDIRSMVDALNIRVNTLWTIDVKAQHEGVLLRLYTDVGQHIEEGQLLAVLQNEGLQARLAAAEAEIEEARAALINADQTVIRYATLVQNDAISVQEYDSAVAQRDAARARLDSRISQRDMTKAETAKMDIFAPQAAEVIRVYHGQGDYVRAGEALLLLSDLGELSAYSIMTHHELSGLLAHGKNFVMEIQPHRLTHRAYPISATPSREGALAINQFLVTVDRISPAMSSDANYHEVFWHVSNPSWIMEPTYYNNVKIFSVEMSSLFGVPLRAVHQAEDDSGSFVYGLDEEERLVRRPVMTGVTDGDFIEISEGLAPGDIVITDNPVGYTEGMKVKTHEEPLGDGRAKGILSPVFGKSRGHYMRNERRGDEHE